MVGLVGARVQDQQGRGGHSRLHALLRGWFSSAATVILCLLFPTARLAAQEPEVPEVMLKSAFLYNFTKFVTWPETVLADSDDSLRLCVLGEGSLATTIQEIHGRRASQRSIVVDHDVAISSLHRCHILFLSRSEEPRLELILREIDGTSILSVSDIDRFAERGGIIGMVTADESIHIEINLAAAERAKLAVSSRLLALARIVGPRPE